ncbi:hypothetical protein RQP46_000371 [Phenoliferia psychrophenolica]
MPRDSKTHPPASIMHLPLPRPRLSLTVPIMLAISLSLSFLLFFTRASPLSPFSLNLRQELAARVEAPSCDAHRNGSNVDVFKTYTITDDNRSQYLYDPNYSYFGPVVGRYANRIRNSSFSIPTKRDLSDAAPGTIYHVTPNENHNNDTLHGGVVGTSHSGWSLLKHAPNQLVFGLLDSNGTEGFPGTVSIRVTYTLKRDSTFIIEMDATAYEPTPLLLSSHVYWNLDGYIESQTIKNHTLLLKSDKYVEGDGIEVPTGVIGEIGEDSPLNFRTPRTIGSKLNDTLGICGTGCIGIDTCFIYEEDCKDDEVKMELSSAASGIKLSIKTNQPAGQVYTCSGQLGLTPRKASQGGPTTNYDQYSCVVLEQEGWIDAINQPQWGQNQIYGTPGREDYHWWSEYSFSTF